MTTDDIIWFIILIIFLWILYFRPEYDCALGTNYNNVDADNIDDDENKMIENMETSGYIGIVVGGIFLLILLCIIGYLLSRKCECVEGGKGDVLEDTTYSTIPIVQTIKTVNLSPDEKLVSELITEGEVGEEGG